MSELPELPESVSGEALTRLPLSLVITDPKQPDNPIVYVNRAFTLTTGYAADAVIGRNCRFLQGEHTDPKDVSALRAAVRHGREITRDIINYRANGERFLNRLVITPIYADGSEEVDYFLGLQMDYSDHISYVEKALELDERLREIQHRVKNHLSVIVSLIRLQANSREAKDASVLLANRVEAISLLYDQLASDGNGNGEREVPLGAYVTRVCAAMQSLSDRTAVRVNVDAARIDFPLEDAARLGLVLSEVLTNALQHAFDVSEAGEIRVNLSGDDESFVLTVADDGKGLGDAKWPDRDSLGGRIVLDLISRLKGDLNVSSTECGTIVELNFRRSKRRGDATAALAPPPPG